MLLKPKLVMPLITQRSFKNFGHKRQPIPFVTTLWHGFLTFTFIGMCLNWDRISTWIIGEDSNHLIDWDDSKNS